MLGKISTSTLCPTVESRVHTILYYLLLLFYYYCYSHLMSYIHIHIPYSIFRIHIHTCTYPKTLSCWYISLRYSPHTCSRAHTYFTLLDPHVHTTYPRPLVSTATLVTGDILNLRYDHSCPRPHLVVLPILFSVLPQTVECSAVAVEIPLFPYSFFTLQKPGTLAYRAS